MKLFFKFIFAFCRFFSIRKAMFYFYNVDEAEQQFFDIFLDSKYDIELNNPKVIIDIGSNIGMSLLYFKKKYGCAQYVGIEPNPDVFRILIKNCTGFAKLYNVAAKDLEFKTFVYTTTDSTTCSLAPVGSISYMTDAVAISSITNNYDSIDLVKISTNGSENNILLDLQKNSQFAKIKNIIVETDSTNLTTIFNCLKNYNHIIKPFKNKLLIYGVQA